MYMDDKMTKYNLLQQITKLRNIYAANGLDLFIPFNVKSYNDNIDPKYKLPTFGKKDGNCQAILVGNTGRIWPYFVDAVKHDTELSEIHHPFDTWVRTVVERGVNDTVDMLGKTELKEYSEMFAQYPESVQNADAAAGCSVHFSFDSAPGKMVAMQHLCHSIGFGYYDKSSFVVSHRVLGPWFALRAVIVLDTDVLLPTVEGETVYPVYGGKNTYKEGTVNMPISRSSLTFTSSDLGVNSTFSFVNHSGVPLHPCIEAGCLELHHTALQDALSKKPYTPSVCDIEYAYTNTTPYKGEAVFPLHAECANIRARWTAPGLAFQPVRSTCNVGKAWRYTEELNLFHYAHDRNTIAECLSRQH